MKTGFLRHFLVFTPLFALISIAGDFMFDRVWPPEFLEVIISAVIAGTIYALVMASWVGHKKDEGN